VVAQQGAEPPWPVTTHSAELYESGAMVGRLEVTRSFRQVLVATGAAALVGIVLATLVYFLLRILPLRALNRVFNALKQEQVLAEERLESMGRMVQELAVAKDAAEAALTENEKITRALHAAQSELLTTARQAGMAEIANNVLHNVGNVLNSVNISAGLVTSTMRGSRVQGLGKAVQLLNEHASDLGEFLTRDAKGRLLPGYLDKLATALAVERQGVIDELGSLTKGIDHIKDIVATQQSYAGVASMVSPVSMAELLEDALRMNSGTLARCEVTVVRKFADVPVLLLDKPRLLQILVNVVANAIQAMDAAPGRRHQLTLEMEVATVAGSECLLLRVIDTGEGIAEDNVQHLFVHGFTTRRNGHGFGLHSSALAAREMRGALTAHSDGPGTGATFTLELPLNIAGDVK
jgi:signal transduction histidine kinase